MSAITNPLRPFSFSGWISTGDPGPDNYLGRSIHQTITSWCHVWMLEGFLWRNGAEIELFRAAILLLRSSVTRKGRRLIYQFCAVNLLCVCRSHCCVVGSGDRRDRVLHMNLCGLFSCSVGDTFRVHIASDVDWGELMSDVKGKRVALVRGRRLAR